MSMLPPNSSLPLVAAMYNPPRPSSSPLLPNRLDPRVWKMNIFIYGQPNRQDKHFSRGRIKCTATISIIPCGQIIARRNKNPK